MKIEIFIALFLTVCISNGVQPRALVNHVSSSATPSNVDDAEPRTETAQQFLSNQVNIHKQYETQATMPATEDSGLLTTFDDGFGPTTVSSPPDQTVGPSVETKQETPNLNTEEIDGSTDEEKKTTAEQSTELPSRVDDAQFRIFPGTSNEKTEKQDTRLYKTYVLDSKPSDLKLIKEDTIIQEHVNRLPPNAKIRIRRKKRNADHFFPNGRPEYSTASSNCVVKPFWDTTSFFFAVSGWTFFMITGIIFIKYQYSVIKKYQGYSQWLLHTGSKDIEDQSDRMRFHYKIGQPPTMEVIDEENENGYIPDPPEAPLDNTENDVWLSNRELHHNKLLTERRKIIRRFTLGPECSDFSSGISYAQSVIVGGHEKERMDRKSAEKRAVIQRHSADIRRPSLVEEIQFAKSVILEEDTDLSHEKKILENRKLIRRRSCGDSTGLSEDSIKYAARVLVLSEQEKQCNHRASEKRRVIKEATANERRGSLLEEITFARSVILPSDEDKDLDEDALLRRQLIKCCHESSGRRMSSLREDILLAKNVILPERKLSTEIMPRFEALLHFETLV